LWSGDDPDTHVADLAGELAKRLCPRAGGRLSKAFFASSEKCRRECIAQELFRLHISSEATPIWLCSQRP